MAYQVQVAGGGSFTYDPDKIEADRLVWRRRLVGCSLALPTPHCVPMVDAVG